MYNLFVFFSCWQPVERRSCARRVLNLSDRSSNALALPACLFSMKSTPFFFFTHSQLFRVAFKKNLYRALLKKETTIAAALGGAPVDKLMGSEAFERACVRVRSTRCIGTKAHVWIQRHRTQTSLSGFGPFFFLQEWGEREVRVEWQQLQKQQQQLLLKSLNVWLDKQGVQGQVWHG